MSDPWLHESEMDAARAEHAAGDLLGGDGRAFQAGIDATLERDPAFAAWADARHLERWGTPRPRPADDVAEPDIEAGQ